LRPGKARHYFRVNDLRHLIEAKARRARHQYGFAAMLKRAEKIGFDLAFGGKFPVDARIVEAGHRPRAEAERPCGDDQ
jgi:hypothetical protein